MEQKMIPYFCHEGDMARAERTIRRLWILCILLIFLFVGSNIAWLYYESQFTEEVTVTQEADTDGGGDAIVNNSGEVINGTRKADSNKKASP